MPGWLVSLMGSKLFQWFFSKEKIIGFGAGIILAVAGAVLNIQPAKLKEYVCSANVPPAIELPLPVAPAPVVPAAIPLPAKPVK